MKKEPFSKRLLDFIVSHKIWSCLIGMGVILLPLLFVHIAFQFNGPTYLQAVWSAGEVLGYLGAILGAAATIVAIVITVQITAEGRADDHQHQMEERKLSMKPHFQTTHNPVFSKNEATQLANGKTVFVSYPAISGREDDITPGSTLDVPHLLKSKKSSIKAEEIHDQFSFTKDFYILKYVIENVGAGNAVNVQFCIDEMPFIPAFSLVVNTSKEFVFIFRKTLAANGEHRIVFDYEYSDVATMARYKQSEVISLFCEDDGALNSRQSMDDLISMPTEVYCDIST